MGTFTNSEDPDEMPHNEAFYPALHCGFSLGSTLFVKVKKNPQTKIQYFFKNCNLTPLDMYNGLSQVYCFKPEGRIH